MLTKFLKLYEKIKYRMLPDELLYWVLIGSVSVIITWGLIVYIL